MDAYQSLGTQVIANGREEARGAKIGGADRVRLMSALDDATCTVLAQKRRHQDQLLNSFRRYVSSGIVVCVTAVLATWN